MGRKRAPGVQYIRRRSDLRRIIFQDGAALVEVPVELLRCIRFKNDKREGGERLDRVERSIRNRGYVPLEPIIARIGQKGRWIVVDGGHRLTAARRVAGEFWANLFGPKVRTLYFLLYETPRSWRKAPNKRPVVEEAEEQDTPEPNISSEQDEV